MLQWLASELQRKTSGMVDTARAHHDHTHPYLWAVGAHATGAGIGKIIFPSEYDRQQSRYIN